MNTRRGGLGRGLGALIPTGPGRQVPAEQVAAEPAGTPAAERPAESQRIAPGQVSSRNEDEHQDRAATGTAGSDGARYAAGSDGATSDDGRVAMVPVPGAHYAELPVGDIRPNPKQPRQVFDEAALDELAHSLREVGFLQPVVVRTAEGGGYELVMGERRWRAAQQAGLATIPAIVKDTGDDAMLRDALLENLHREQLNPLEEGAAYAQLLEEFGATHDELARRIGRSRSQVTNTIRLLNLPPAVQRRVAAGVLSAGHARALLGLEDSQAQEQLAQRIVAEGLSVRAVEELVALGDNGGRRRTARAPRHHSPALNELAAGLSDHFETRVRVDFGRHRGKIVIEFASVDDLERIVAAMAPTLHDSATPHDPALGDPAAGVAPGAGAAPNGDPAGRA